VTLALRILSGRPSQDKVCVRDVVYELAGFYDTACAQGQRLTNAYAVVVFVMQRFCVALHLA